MLDIVITLSSNLFRVYILYRFMRLFFTRRRENLWKEWISYAGLYILTAAIQMVFHLPPLNMLVNIIGIYLVTAIYEGGYKKKLFVTLLVYSINAVCDFISYRVWENYEFFAYMTVFFIAVAEFVVEKIVTKSNAKGEIPHFGVLIVISMISIGQMNLLAQSKIENRILVALFCVSVLVVDLLIFYLYDVLVKAYRNLAEKAELEKQTLIYANQLEVLTQSEERIKSVRHDMKNHLAALASLAEQGKSEEVTAYIAQIGEHMENPEERVKSGNESLDSLLNYFLGKAEKCLKQVEYQVQVPKEMEVPAFDMNVILGNLMDNAIEAAAVSAEKFLAVHLNYVNGVLVIEVENSFQHELRKENGKYLTTKQGTDHGIGLGNVQKMVEKYDGSMELEEKDGLFQVCVELFVNK